MRILADEFVLPELAKEMTDLGVEPVIVGFEHLIDQEWKTRDAADPKACFDWAFANVPVTESSLVMLDYESHDEALTMEWRESLNQCVRAIRTLRNLSRVALYGYPWLDPWPGKRQWCDPLLDPVAAAETLALDQSVYESVTRACDWLCVCCYDSEGIGAIVDHAAAFYKTKRCRLAKRIAGARQAIGAVCLYRAPRFLNDPLEHQLLPVERIFARQVQPPMLARLDGVMLWQQERWKTGIACGNTVTDLQSQLRYWYEQGFALMADFWLGAQPLADLRLLIHRRTIDIVKSIRTLST